MKTINLMIAIWLFLTACGTDVRVKGKAQYEATGEVKTTHEIVLKIDVSACENLLPEEQAACIKSMLGSMEALVELVQKLQCAQGGCPDESNVPNP